MIIYASKEIFLYKYSTYKKIFSKKFLVKPKFNCHEDARLDVDVYQSVSKSIKVHLTTWRESVVCVVPKWSNIIITIVRNFCNKNSTMQSKWCKIFSENQTNTARNCTGNTHLTQSTAKQTSNIFHKNYVKIIWCFIETNQLTHRLELAKTEMNPWTQN